MQLISKLKSKNSEGHALISNNLLKAITHEIVKLLTFIINQSLKTGTFPDRSKVAKVRPQKFGTIHFIYYINRSIATKVDSTYLGY